MRDIYGKDWHFISKIPYFELEFDHNTSYPCPGYLEFTIEKINPDGTFVVGIEWINTLLIDSNWSNSFNDEFNNELNNELFVIVKNQIKSD